MYKLIWKLMKLLNFKNYNQIFDRKNNIFSIILNGKKYNLWYETENILCLCC